MTMLGKGTFIFGMGLSLALSGCGLYTPTKDIALSETPDTDQSSPRSRYETEIVNHVMCEIGRGLYAAYKAQDLPWLKSEKWGTSVTLTMTALDQSGVNPGVTVINPFLNGVRIFPVNGNFTSPQSFSFGIGASGAANATRTETIQFTLLNSDLVDFATLGSKCTYRTDGFQVDAELKISDFLFTKTFVSKIANLGGRNDPSSDRWPSYNTFTEELTFTTVFGGSVTPTWKFMRVTADTNASLAAIQRTFTNDVIITVGPVSSPPTKNKPASLDSNAQNQHNAKVQANAIATSIKGLGQ